MVCREQDQEAIQRVQTYIMLDSKHPVEKEDVRRGLMRSLEAAERALAEAVEVLTTLESVADQFTTDLSAAHAEICNLQGIDPSKHTWPDWSAPANTLRWWAKEKPRARAFLTKRGEK